MNPSEAGTARQKHDPDRKGKRGPPGKGKALETDPKECTRHNAVAQRGNAAEDAAQHGKDILQGTSVAPQMKWYHQLVPYRKALSGS